MNEERKIELHIAVDLSAIPDDEWGNMALVLEREWAFKYALEMDAKYLFGPLDGKVDPKLLFEETGYPFAPPDQPPIDIVKNSAQRRVSQYSRSTSRPIIQDAVTRACVMTKNGWHEVSAYSVELAGEGNRKWDLQQACRNYKTQTGHAIESNVEEMLLMANLSLLVHVPLLAKAS